MARFKLTEDHKKFIRGNYQNTSRKQMARELNIGVTPINTYMKKEGLSVSKAQSERFRIAAMTGRTTFTEKEDNFIKENYLKMPIKTLAKELKRSVCGVSGRLRALGLKIPKETIEQRKKDSYYKPGRIPENKGKKQSEYMSVAAMMKAKKTQFKKGNKPHNTRYNGHERVTKDGYIEVRISENNYKLKHLYNWEQLHGKLPKGHCLKCIDGNKNNTDPDNWNLITRTENMLRNSKHNYPEKIIPSMVLMNQINKKINTLQDG